MEHDDFPFEEDDDEKRLRDLLDDMVKEMNDPKELQQSYQRDYSNKNFRELHADKQAYVDLQFEMRHIN